MLGIEDATQGDFFLPSHALISLSLCLIRFFTFLGPLMLSVYICYEIYFCLSPSSPSPSIPLSLEQDGSASSSSSREAKEESGTVRKTQAS